MGAGGIAGGADLSHLLALRHLLAEAHGNGMQMSIVGKVSAAVIDHYEVAPVRIVAGSNDLAGGNGKSGNFSVIGPTAHVNIQTRRHAVDPATGNTAGVGYGQGPDKGTGEGAGESAEDENQPAWMSFPIDPETGYRVDPATGNLLDAETGDLINKTEDNLPPGA